jgi:hypothetical protein
MFRDSGSSSGVCEAPRRRADARVRTVTGNALREARRFLGYTQPQMAEFLDVSLATYQRREAMAEEHIPGPEGFQVEAMVMQRSGSTEGQWIPASQD